MSEHAPGHDPLPGPLDGHHARCSLDELCFGLVHVLVVTRPGHELLAELTLTGVAETPVLWFAVWLGWQCTCRVTNRSDPETPRIRPMLFAVTLAGLVMASAIPGALGERGLVFALAYKVVYGAVPASHIAGVATLTALVPIASRADLLAVGWPTPIVMLAVGVREGRLLDRHRANKPARQAVR